MTMDRYRTRSEADTAALGAAIGELLMPGDALLLQGDLGAGKSVLARGVARALGVSGAMPSPTFTLMQAHEGRLPVYHFDLYRLADEEEFYAAGLDDYIDANGVCLIEWPMEGVLPISRIALSIARGDGEEQREIALDFAHFARAEQLRGALRDWEVDA